MNMAEDDRKMFEDLLLVQIESIDRTLGSIDVSLGKLNNILDGVLTTLGYISERLDR
jgi:hypothetical protein